MRATLALTLLLAACGAPSDDADADTLDTDVSDTDASDTDAGDTDLPDGVPSVYAFGSAVTGAADSVSYDGQVMRYLLIADLARTVGGLTARLEGGFAPEAGDVTAELEFFLSFDSEIAGSTAHLFTATPAPDQSTYDDVSTNKQLWDKLAGNDAVGQHEEWSTGFIGWSADGVTTPQSLVEHWVALLDAAAVDWSNGTIAEDPDGADVPHVFVTADGLDLQQLLQKFLVGAIAYSQGADDYLDDDTEGKGLLSDHSAADGSNPYTPLEHQWDEGFGYFGAARTYVQWTDEERAAGPKDVDESGGIDLLTEMTWGHAQNAAKRDLGAIVATDYTTLAWEGFAGGRALLAAADGPLSDEELAALRGFRDKALEGWEKAIAATVVHYINDTLQDMGKMGTEAYSFGDHAKHWGELKGFALSLQFSPYALITDAQLETLHAYLGTRPVLSDAGGDALDDYADDLRAARALLGTAYGFDPDNLGEDDGTNGW